MPRFGAAPKLISANCARIPLTLLFHRTKMLEFSDAVYNPSLIPRASSMHARGNKRKDARGERRTKCVERGGDSFLSFSFRNLATVYFTAGPD